jgi:hypothetical protein
MPRKPKLQLFFATALVCHLLLLTAELATAEPEFRPQHIPPASLINGWEAEGEFYAEPSVSRKLVPGQRVKAPDFGTAATG